MTVMVFMFWMTMINKEKLDTSMVKVLLFAFIWAVAFDITFIIGWLK